ncbi:MAG: hypothetical protein ACE361_08320 [Aureliella sp.]
MEPVEHEIDHGWRLETVFWLAVLACTFFLFHPGLLRSEVPAFRDGLHFYYPQIVWLNDCAQQGEFFPLWNRFDGLGASVPGQVSTALFYPGRLILLLPVFLNSVSIEQAYSGYLAFHVLIASIGFRYACRVLAVPQLGSLLGTLAFGLSAPLVFQHCNLIYLCSAAWLGFATAGAGLILIQERASLGLALLAISLSAMVLAGDPHTAVNCYLLFAVALGVQTIFIRPNGAHWLPQFARAVFSFTWPILLVVVLTSVQWLPALRWAEHSSRTSREGGQSELESGSDEKVVLSADHEVVRSALAKLTLSKPLKYEFSLSPWHLATAIWPLAGGFYLPDNSRWFDSIPAEGRTWVPSLYSGAIPLFVLLLSFRSRGPTRFLLVAGILTTLAAMGNYSPTWLLRELLVSLRFEDLAQLVPSDRSSALYEALNQLVPGYSKFRYPAKWFAISSLCFSLVVAMNSSRILHGLQMKYRPSSVLFWGVLAGSAVLTCTAVALRFTDLRNWFESQQVSDVLLGRCSAVPTANALLLSALLPACSLILLLAMRKTKHLEVIAILILIVELGFVNQQLVHYVEREALTPSQTVIGLRPARAPGSEANPRSSPLVWTNVSRASLSRFTNSDEPLGKRQVDLQNQFLIGKLAILGPARCLSAIQTIEPECAEKIRLWLSSQDTLRSKQDGLDFFLATLGVDARLVAIAPAQADSRRLAKTDWQTVPGTKPLVECFPLPETVLADQQEEQMSGPQAPRILSAVWMSQSTLNVLTECSADYRLLVRQFNDGGWHISSNGPDGPVSLEPLATPSVFLEIQIPAKTDRIVISRRWGW